MSQSEAERRLCRNFNLLVPGQSPPDKTRCSTHTGTDSGARASASDASYQRTTGRSSAGSGSCPLTLSLYCAAEHAGLDLIRMSAY